MSVNHYENFPVASILCPKRLRPAVVALYWFARNADDIADEGDASPEQRLADLAAYRANIPNLLGGVIAQYQLPVHHLHELLDAFELDVRNTAAGHRYTSYDELLGYCKLSANPVGRLMLHLYGVHDEESKVQSDAICTALQLINFWQDVSVDEPRGRFYVPPSNRPNLDARQALSSKARELMMAGSPLCKRLSKQGHLRFSFELKLVVQGGLRILDKMSDTQLNGRPKLSKWDMPIIFYRALVQ